MEHDFDNIEIFEDFEGSDRFDFPCGLVRVTSGFGGEVMLVPGSAKTALVDCGMAYCGKQTVENIKAVLDRGPRAMANLHAGPRFADKPFNSKQIDYVFLSHTHYDHIGALPYILEEWPDAIVIGNAKAKAVFQNQGALDTIKQLGKVARDSYAPVPSDVALADIPVEGLRIDRVVKDGDMISLGDEIMTVLEAKGHTDCSLAFVLDPPSLMFASETTGVLECPTEIGTPILKSYRDTVVSLEKCRNLRVNYILNPHFGMIPPYFNDKYWQLFENCLNDKVNFINTMRNNGLSMEEMIKVYTEKYWVPERSKEQPKEAFIINAGNIIKALSI